jgi:hypothetical protein
VVNIIRLRSTRVGGENSVHYVVIYVIVNVVPHSIPVPTRYQLQNPTEWTTKLVFKLRLVI